MDSIEVMRSFIRIIETGNFSAVAKEQNTSQATISKRIASLENKLGTRLLVRGSREHTLTEAGKKYYESVSNIILEIDEAEAEARSMTSTPKGVLRVAAPTMFCGMFIVPVLPKFLMTYPEIKVDMSLDEKKVDLVKEGVDVAIRLGDLLDSSLVAKRLGDHELIIVSSPRYLKKHSSPRHLQELPNHNCLTYSLLPKKGATWVLNEKNKTVEIEVSGNFQCDNGIGLKEMLLANAGIALMPKWLVHEEIESGKLVHILTDYYKRYPISAVFSKSRYTPLKVRCFLDFMENMIINNPSLSKPY